ncbi:MAG: OmpA family protein [Bacteroidia bacterium]
MKNIVYTVLATSLLTACSTKMSLKEADKHYNNLEYHTAAVQYSQYLKTKKDNKAQLKLAECYMHMNHFAEAEKEYATAITYPEVTPQNELHYAHVLKHNGKYGEAKKWYGEYLKNNPGDVAATNELRSCDSIKNYNRFSYQYEINPAYAAKTESNFSPVFYKNGIIFCSEHTKPSHTTGVSQWTGHSYLDLYFSEVFAAVKESPHSVVSTDGNSEHYTKESLKPHEFSEPVPFANEINSLYNEGPACFSKDEKTIYFTRNILDKKNKPETNKESISSLEIYKSVLSGSKWSQPELLNFENKDYSSGHPALSKDEKRLYFVSDKPGGQGGTDLYYSDLKDGKWSEPVNLGSAINTNENEMFPTINIDEKGNEILYYSTDGMAGMGGLDIYYTTIKNGAFEKPVHLNAPLNSSADDFGIIFCNKGLDGFFSSNRDETDGSDKLYHFKKYVPEFYLEITVKKKGTDEVIPSALVDIKFLSGKKSTALFTDQKGKIFEKIDANSQLEIIGKKDFFFTASTTANNTGKIFSDTLRVTLNMEAIVINKPIRLDNIYYDYNKWDIRPDAKPELDKLVKVMVDNPGIIIELSSHTDSRGGDNFNMKLSQKRAESAVKYIIEAGIATERICAKGYGESKPLNRCVNKVKCTEEEFQLNRRTEFKVVKFCTPPVPNSVIIQ